MASVKTEKARAAGAFTTMDVRTEVSVVCVVIDAPRWRSVTSPASFSTFRCCDTAGRLTGNRCASSPTGDGPSASSSKTARRVGSPNALTPAPT